MNIQNTLAERQTTHGDFDEVARVSQQLKDTVITGPSYCTLTLSQREALSMILYKAARIVCGNPHTFDHWHDISGYASLITQTMDSPEV